MLYDVKARRIFEQPARKYLVPGQLLVCIGAFFHKHLNERTFILWMLPRKAFFARRHFDDQTADAPRFAGLHHHVLREIVALVQHAKSNHALAVGRADLLPLRRLRWPGLHPGDGIGHTGIFGVRGRLSASAS